MRNADDELLISQTVLKHYGLDACASEIWNDSVPEQPAVPPSGPVAQKPTDSQRTMLAAAAAASRKIPEVAVESDAALVAGDKDPLGIFDAALS